MSKVGIVTPLYATESNGRLPGFGNTIKSVLAQEDAFLWLIVDDGSPDPAAGAYLDRLAGVDSRIRVLRRQRKPGDQKTSSNALNSGMAEILESDCSCVTYLHSDDWLLRDSIRLRRQCLEGGPDMVYGKQIALAGRKIFEKSPEFRSAARSEGAHFDVVFPHHTAMWRREMLAAMMEERGGELFDPALSYGEDLDVTLFCRNLLATGVYTEKYVEEFVYVWKSDSAESLTSASRQYYQQRLLEHIYSKNGLSYRREAGLRKYLTAYMPGSLRDRLIRALRRNKLPRSAKVPFSYDDFEDDLYWFRQTLDPSVGRQVDALI